MEYPMDKESITEFVYNMLEDEDFEDFLERFNLTPSEVFLILLSGGHIDEELLSEMMGYG